MPKTPSGPSAHLSWDELACRDRMHTAYPIDWRETRAVALGKVFEAIRMAAGNRPIEVLSAFRTPEHNASVGGAPGSMHLQGKALDLRHEHLDARTFGDLIKVLAATRIPEIGGIGQYATFVHVDIRPRPHHGQIVTWEG